jgi:hypothetical protein
MKPKTMFLSLALLLSAGLSAADCIPLVVNQNDQVGLVCYDSNGSDLTVTYYTTDALHLLSHVDLWVGASPSGIPRNPAGKPMPSKFPLHADVASLTTYSFNISLPLLGLPCGSTLTVAAHADVTDLAGGDARNAWSAGTPFTAKEQWGSYSQFVLPCPGGVTGTPTVTSTPTETVVVDTPTPTNTPTDTPVVDTPTPTDTPTETPVVDTPTPTNTPTETPVVDTATPTNTPTNTETPEDTATPTNTPTETEIPLATATETPAI